jgi:hypothetical protein
MTFTEFCTLLSGIMPKTPLGQMVSIRSEDNEDMLKNYTKEQHEIRNNWRTRNNPVANMTDEEKEEKINEVQELFRNIFS